MIIRIGKERMRRDAVEPVSVIDFLPNSQTPESRRTSLNGRARVELADKKLDDS